MAVITPKGIYPDENDFRRKPETTVIAEVLKAAADHFKITNTLGLGRQGRGTAAQRRTRRSSTKKLSGIVEIKYHKHEGGGGA